MIFSIGAVFNGVYTMSHPDEFYGGFADGAWLAPAGRFVNQVVIPNATLFTLLLIGFQATVGVLIFTRGDLATAALFAGAGFAFLAALASSPAGTIANLGLAAIQLSLALARIA